MLVGAWRAGRNTFFLLRLLAVRVFTGLCEDGGMDGEDLRLAVYLAFAETGRAPRPGELAARLDTDVQQVAAGLGELARGRHLALGDQGQILMAHLFCSEGCVDAWLAATGSARGYVMDLGTLWLLAAHWYDGRLDRGYVRREPSQAASYLRGVGLTGSFWGL
jgi:hypothetical protein